MLQEYVSVVEEKEGLREGAEDIPCSTRGISDGYDPHMLEPGQLVKKKSAPVSAETIARCWMKTGTLPIGLQAELTSQHRKM